jgi:hypothetical protein
MSSLWTRLPLNRGIEVIECARQNTIARFNLDPMAINHVFVDFENVHEIALAIIGSKGVHFTLLLGSTQTRLEASLVEKLLEHAASVQLVRLASSGRDALDFTLAYYMGRAVAADPTGAFHIVSKDTGYDPLIEHLQSKNVRAFRHDDFASLTFNGTAKRRPAVAPKQKVQSLTKGQPADVDKRAAQVLEQLRKASTSRPKNKKTLVNYLVGQLGRRITEAEALNLIETHRKAGHLAICEKGIVTYNAVEDRVRKNGHESAQQNH